MERSMEITTRCVSEGSPISALSGLHDQGTVLQSQSVLHCHLLLTRRVIIFVCARQEVYIETTAPGLVSASIT